MTERLRRRKPIAAGIVAFLFGLSVTVLPAFAAGGEVLVAVAANFAEVIERLEPDFERESGHRLTITTGSTGALYAQVRNGAPFDVLLAADQERPELLEKYGEAVAGSRFTYAVGRLTLWSADPALIGADGEMALQQAEFRRLAVANPALAPYGRAARETLISLDLYERLADRLVMGQNVGQAHALVATGNAELGFVALSYVVSPRNDIAGSRWDVPQKYYSPIRQDGVLLSRAVENSAALDFIAYLRREDVAAVARGFGYDIPAMDEEKD